MDELLNLGGKKSRKRAPVVELNAELPKGLVAPVAMPIEMQRTFYASVAKILRNPSLAYRKDRTLMKQMRNDPDCMGPLTQLQVSIAGLEWQLKPFDSRDPVQEEIATRVSDILREMPRLSDMIRHLLDAVWYGSSACNVIYARKTNGDVVVEDWLPFHPDTLITDEDGHPGIKVGVRYYSGDPESTNGETTQGFDSRIHKFTDIERRAVMWHRYMVHGPDFDDPYETAYAYMGKGVRDTVWWYWNLKQAVLQNWATFAERYAQGIRVGYYPMAQKGAKEDMENILRNLVGDVSAVVPRSTPGQKDYEIEILEPTAARAQVFADLTEWLAKNIKELIVGQSATSEGVSTGIGSNVATEHSKTFTRQMRFVAGALAETITEQLVKELVDMNFGTQDHYPRFEFAVESPEMRDKLEAIRVFVNELGGTVSEAETRKLLGLAIPDMDEPVLTGKLRDVMQEWTNDEQPVPEAGFSPMISSREVFKAMTSDELRREGAKRRKAGKKNDNCGNGFGGFTGDNVCASGPHVYPETRKSPVKKGKAKNAKDNTTTQEERVRGGELLDAGLSIEQSIRVAARERMKDADELLRTDAHLFAAGAVTFVPPESVARAAAKAMGELEGDDREIAEKCARREALTVAEVRQCALYGAKWVINALASVEQRNA